MSKPNLIDGSSVIPVTDRQELRQLAETAPPGPWDYNRAEDGEDFPGYSILGGGVGAAEHQVAYVQDFTNKRSEATAAFITAFNPDTARRLLDQLDAVDALFSMGPDTSCRTVWEDGVECVSVPLADLRAVLGGGGK